MTTLPDRSRLEPLERRIRQYHGTSVKSVLDVIEYLRDPGDTVLAGGSLAFGFGNPLSDVDVIVAGDTAVGSSRVPLEHFVGSLRVDVCKLARPAIDATFERARRALASPHALHGAFGDLDHETDLKLLHRIAFGVLLDGPDLEDVHNYRDIACRLVVREYAERARASALIAQLSSRVGRGVAAVLAARQAVEDSLNATVAGRGVPFSGDKWLRERLAGEAADLAPCYRDFAVLPEWPREDGRDFVSRAIAVCSDLTARDLTFDAIATGALWENTDLIAATVGDAHFLLSRRFGALWELTDGEHAAWIRLTDAGVDGPWPVDDRDSEELALCVKLHERGLLSLRWASGLPIGVLALGMESSHEGD